MTADFVVGFVLTLFVMMVGLVGTLVPGIPGTPVIFAAALGHRLWFGDRGPAIWVVLTLGVLMALSLAVDFLATTAGAKKLGASHRGMIGAVLGGMIGIFFPPIGLVLGPFLGAMLFEAIGGRDWREASRAGVGAALGFLAGTVGRIACGVAMVGLFVLNVLLAMVRNVGG